MNQIVQRIFCENHNKEINFICCDLLCNQRIFCGKCLRNENHVSHQEKIFTLQEFVDDQSDDVWQAFQRKKRSNFHIDELSELLQQKKRDLIEVIEKEFKELEITLRKYSESFDIEKEKVSEIQKVVKEYLQNQASASDVKSSFDNFKERYYQQISSFQEFSFQQFTWQQQQLQDSIKDLKSRLFCTYEVVDDISLNEIKEDMQQNLIQNNNDQHRYNMNHISFYKEVENKNKQKQINIQSENNNHALLTRHVQENSSQKQLILKLNKPINQLKISFHNKVVLPNPIMIKFINKKYEGLLEIDEKQSVFLISDSNPLQNEKILINLNEKRFSLILNKQSPFMILSMDDKNSTFIKLNEKEIEQKQRQNVEHTIYQLQSKSQSKYPTISIIVSILEVPENVQIGMPQPNLFQSSSAFLTLWNYPPSLDLLGIQYQLE